LSIILPTSRQKLEISPLPSTPLLCISIFVPISKKSLCRTPNITVQAGYLLGIISDYPRQKRRAPGNAAIVAITSYNVVSLQHAAMLDFFLKWLLHLYKFLANPSIDLELVCIIGKPIVDSNDVLSAWKYYQLFTHESNTFLLNKYAIETNGAFTPTKLPLPLGVREPVTPSNTPIPRPTPLTVPNGIRIELAILPQ